MPNRSKSIISNKKSNNTEKIICQNPYCSQSGKEQPNSNFYNTNSKFLPKYPICKECLQKIIDVNDMQTVFNVLKEMDIAFVEDCWKSNCEKNPDNPFGTYMRQMNSLPQYRGLKWNENTEKSGLKENKQSVDIRNIEYIITDDMIKMWGSKHEPEDYIILDNFYNDMKISNNIETAQDMIYLKKIAIISLKLDKALEECNYGEAKQLGDLFSKYMADSKFRAMDKTDADRTGGIRNFGAIYAEVEKDGFIPPWEHYRKIKGISQDIVDKTIMHIENFTLKLNKVDKMTKPPTDTPKLNEDEFDKEDVFEINDIAVDTSFDESVRGD